MSAPETLNLDDLAPVLVPDSLFQAGEWPGPHELLDVPGLGVTWVILKPQQVKRWVDFDAQRYWDRQGVAWMDRAIQNLRKHSEGSDLWTHEYRRDDGFVFAVAMMHPDGVGPSRILLKDQLDRAFPDGYLVAVPERTCALVLSARASDTEYSKIEGVVEECFRIGTLPTVPGLHEPEGFQRRRRR